MNGRTKITAAVALFILVGGWGALYDAGRLSLRVMRWPVISV
jgi:hypothetical protein